MNCNDSQSKELVYYVINQNSPTVKVLLLIQYVFRVISMKYEKKYRRIIDDIQNNGFVTYVMNKKSISVYYKKILSTL